MRLLKRALILVGCVMLLTVLWATFFLGPVKPSHQSLTRHALDQSYEGLRILAVYRPSDYEKLLQQRANLQVEVATRLREVSDLNGLGLDTDDHNRPIDGWGNPLNIQLWQDVRERMSKLDGIAWETNLIVIWSSGPNGSNEFGHGDDLFEIRRYERPQESDAQRRIGVQP